MKTIVILVPDGENNLSSIVGSYKILKRANDYWLSGGKKQKFEIKLAGRSREVKFDDGLFAAFPSPLTKVKNPALIIVPSLNHNYDAAVSENSKLVEWIKEQYEDGSELAAICTGAFLLAASGIMDGKECSTHWSASSELATRFPKIKVIDGKAITYDSRVYTNGGAFSFLKLIIYLVEKYFDRKTALYCAKVFQVELDTTDQSHFIMFSGLKTHDDEMIRRAQFMLEKSVHDKLNIAELAKRLSVGRRTFDRRFKNATGNTALEYYQKLKVEAAKHSLESSRKTVNEIMYDVGYSDQKAFRETFKHLTGLTPLDYRMKFRRMVS